MSYKLNFQVSLWKNDFSTTVSKNGPWQFLRQRKGSYKQWKHFFMMIFTQKKCVLSEKFLKEKNFLLKKSVRK